jgi:phage terminase large subunit
VKVRQLIEFDTGVENYKWKEDQAGKATNIPIDKFNHGIDAARYALPAKVLNRKGW